MDEINIEILRKLCTDRTIKITQHLFDRLRERGIKYIDVKHCILQGEIIESYPDDYPYPSCLVLGYAVNGSPLHVVAGIGGGYLWMITAYYPDNKQWESDLKTRKGNKS